MMIEIHTPELDERLKRGIQDGQFHDVDELLLKALDALEKKQPPASPKTGRTLEEAVAHMLEARKGNRLPPGVTIRDLINEGRA